LKQTELFQRRKSRGLGDGGKDGKRTRGGDGWQVFRERGSHLSKREKRAIERGGKDRHVQNRMAKLIEVSAPGLLRKSWKVGHEKAKDRTGIADHRRRGGVLSLRKRSQFEKKKKSQLKGHQFASEATTRERKKNALANT